MLKRVFVFVLLCLPVVSAVSMQIPSEFDSGVFTLHVDSTEEVAFVFRGDDVAHTVKFFIYTDVGGVLDLNGVSRYEREALLGVYKAQAFAVNMTALRNPGEDITLYYGVIIDTLNIQDEEMGFSNVLMDSVTLRIRGGGIPYSEIDIGVNMTPDDASPSPIPGEGSGGDSSGSHLNPSNSGDEPPELPNSGSDMADITGGGSSLSELRVDDSSTSRGGLSILGASDEPINGKAVASLFIGLLLLLMLLSMVAIKIVKEDSSYETTSK